MARKTKKYPVSVDGAKFSYVAVCDLDGCTWRGCTNTRANAWQMIARHVSRTHAGEHPQIVGDAKRWAVQTQKTT